MAQRVALYCRVSTSKQDTERQERDLRAFAERRGMDVVAIIHETASGAKNDRTARADVMRLARQGRINAVVVSELSRWGRSTVDLIETVNQLAHWGVSLLCESGLEFDLTSPTGKLMLTMFGGFAEFERDLLRDRVCSGLAAARAKGRIGGRRLGDRPSDKHADQVMALLNDGVSVRKTAKQLGISATTVQAIKARATAPA